jgi:hypothetical protein
VFDLSSLNRQLAGPALNYFNYFTEIEDTFVRRRGKHLFLSPLDWALIEAWQDRGIPLHIVLRSIESVFDVFDRQPVGTRTIKSLFYCREEIEAQYGEWLTSQTGASDSGEMERDTPFSPAAVSAHIDNAIGQLRSVDAPGMAEDIDRAISRLAELQKNVPSDPETADKTLGDIERLLERAMLANWDKPRLKAAEQDIARQLREYKTEMDPAAYKTTFDLMLLKRLRDEAGIPRLGLFYL